MSRERATPIAIVAVAILVVGAIVWLTIGGDGDDTATVPSDAPEIVTPDELAAVASESGRPIYWLGEWEGRRLELTREEGGNVYVRYLTGDAEAGDPAADFVTVGTYPVGDGPGAVRTAARNAGTGVARVPEGGIAFETPDGRTSAYLAFPGSEDQIEVYDPKPGEALRFAEEGKVFAAGR